MGIVVHANNAKRESNMSLLSGNSFNSASVGRKAALRALSQFNPTDYKRTRNFLDGNVSKLSPYITHGILSLREIWSLLKSKYGLREKDKFFNELVWRDYFLHVWKWKGSEIFFPLIHDREPIICESSVPMDIVAGKTGLQVIDETVYQLYNTGYVHNHARMWIASYLIHFRKVDWKIAADWFYSHLLDGDLGSNHLSWQWVAGTSRTGIYLFNAENVAKFAPHKFNIKNSQLDKTYEELHEIALSPDPIGKESIGKGENLIEPQLFTSPTEIFPDISESLENDAFIIHPWNIGFYERNNLKQKKIGVIFTEFHQKHPWNKKRWDFVVNSMKETCSNIYLCSNMLHLKSRVTSFDQHLTEVPSFKKGCLTFLSEPIISEVSEKYCKSFSSYWRVVEKKLRTTKLD